MPNAFNVVDEVNRQVLEFVQLSDNRRLIPGTGYYCTPFRGSLFGCQRSAAVAECLYAGRSVDLLWLGTNPCVPESLDYIESPPEHEGHFPSFRLQLESGFFAARLWDSDGNATPDWNPIDMPRGNWRLYRDALARITDLQCVAMANFIPWGSRRSQDLVNRVGNAYPALLQRMLRLADEINIEIVKALKPKAIVVPFSLRAVLQQVGLQMHEDCQHSIRMSGRSFRSAVGLWQRGGLSVAAVYVPHPAALRVPAHDRPDFVNKFSCILANVISAV